VIRGERGQALVEAVAALPVCIACAVAIVDAGAVVRDRIAIAQAAERGAEAQLAGRDPKTAVVGALPKSLRSVTVDVDAHHVRVRASSSLVVAGLVGQRVTQESTVMTDAPEVTR
jgi:Flp pilus assembly protein TadG